jgi:cytochrome c biogenesis factor
MVHSILHYCLLVLSYFGATLVGFGLNCDNRVDIELFGILVMATSSFLAFFVFASEPMRRQIDYAGRPPQGSILSFGST